MPRSRLGPLAIESKLGDHPSTSTVWRAVHVDHRKAVAVKVFSAPFGGTPEARREFAEEWESLKSLAHPGVAKCFGGGFEETDAYLAYELVDGETLSSQLERSGRLSWENVLDLAQGLIEAIEYLHGQGIVHGAIVTSKIVVTGFAPVLLDVRRDRHESPFRSSRPPHLAEVACQAPELVNAAVQAQPSPASELYSFGALLYHAVTGRLPVAGETVQEVRANVTSQTPASPASIVLQCPVWFDKLITQLLEKDPSLRPVSATAVKLALAEVRKRALSRSGVAEHVSGGFSALQVTDQTAKDEARTLLGRGVVDLDAKEKRKKDSGPVIVWHDQPWLLIGGFVLILGFLTYIAWPASEDSLKSRAERLMSRETRVALAEARDKPLRQLLNRFPDGEHSEWAKQQVAQINVKLFLDQLAIKIKNNGTLEDQGELLHKQAQEIADNGDAMGAIAKYESMITVLGDDPDYLIAVNAAKKERDRLREEAESDTSAEKLVRSKLEKADSLAQEGRIEEAKAIWESLVDLYDNNSQLESLIDQAKLRLNEGLTPDES
ncbi:MAG: serine/threonine-protein kinase [Planctomycetota bacterium]